MVRGALGSRRNTRKGRLNEITAPTYGWGAARGVPVSAARAGGQRASGRGRRRGRAGVGGVGGAGGGRRSREEAWEASAGSGSAGSGVAEAGIAGRKRESLSAPGALSRPSGPARPSRGVLVAIGVCRCGLVRPGDRPHLRRRVPRRQGFLVLHAVRRSTYESRTTTRHGRADAGVAGVDGDLDDPPTASPRTRVPESVGTGVQSPRPPSRPCGSSWCCSGSPGRWGRGAGSAIAAARVRRPSPRRLRRAGLPVVVRSVDILEVDDEALDLGPVHRGTTESGSRRRTGGDREVAGLGVVVVVAGEPLAGDPLAAGDVVGRHIGHAVLVRLVPGA